MNNRISVETAESGRRANEIKISGENPHDKKTETVEKMPDFNVVLRKNVYNLFRSGFCPL